jgi:hypothetical protein
MLRNNFSDVLVVPAGCRVDRNTITLEVRLPWYRSLPLSVVEIAAVNIDGTALSLAGASIELNGRSYPVGKLPDLVNESWFMLDSAWLRLSNPGICAGGPHEASLLLKLYPPYVPALTWATWGTASITA